MPKTINDIEELKIYCNSLNEYSRFNTREVPVGDVPLGGNNPIRIQSMTTTDTMDTDASVEQSIRIINSGCDYVRLTAPSLKDARNLKNIKQKLIQKGYKTPLIADIHFTPNAAEEAARIVEKVRINPGNYADRKKFETIEYTDAMYQEELERITERLIPFINICKQYGTAVRIGTNHGSLSDRIMSRYGDTPIGMVESALEFVRIFESENFYNIVLSMKSSNPQVMVQAYRLLVNKMISEGMNYPLHLGVTEAGGGEDGRIKSAMGIGTLLEDGLGDTIRVSLTEDPEFEAPVARQILSGYKNRSFHKPIKKIISPLPYNPFEYSRRKTFDLLNIGNSSVPVVIADLSAAKSIDYNILKDIGYIYNAESDKWQISDMAADLVFLNDEKNDFNFPTTLKIIYDFNVWLKKRNNKNSFPLLTPEEYLSSRTKSTVTNFIKFPCNLYEEKLFDKIKDDKTAVLVLESDNENWIAEVRRMIIELMNKGIENPIILKKIFLKESLDELRLFASTDFGSLLIDGFGDGIWLSFKPAKKSTEENSKRTFLKYSESNYKIINRIGFAILQAARVRISKTEFIACPSCGRTLFDLQETTNKIKSKTEHLKGLKIAVMGCIVNGPGEMADADYGYVGSGIGKITLYRGKNIVRRNLPSENAVNELIELIKEDGLWYEPN